jgi:23S rRNA pseudouridine2457 synthase
LPISFPVRDVYPAGRLDADSEGLVVLTADGALQARITSPRGKLAKVYWVEVEGSPTRAQQRALRVGVELPDVVTAPAKATLIAAPPTVAARPADPRAQGDPHRVARADAHRRPEPPGAANDGGGRAADAAPHPVCVGPWTLDRLAPGAWRSRIGECPRAIIARAR